MNLSEPYIQNGQILIDVTVQLERDVDFFNCVLSDNAPGKFDPLKLGSVITLDARNWIGQMSVVEIKVGDPPKPTDEGGSADTKVADPPKPATTDAGGSEEDTVPPA